MNELLWKVIEESKDGMVYLSSKQQYKELVNILACYNKETVEKIEDVWREKKGQLMNDEFELLHAENGGIISSGDDGFYMDFANWVIAQGEGLFNRFKKEGHKAVLDYIQTYRVPVADYMYECMGYVFQDYVA